MAYADVLTDHLHAAEFQYPLKLPDLFSRNLNRQQNRTQPNVKQIKYLFFQEHVTIQ